MKHLLVLLALSFSSSIGFASQASDLDGKITNVFVGELDPDVVGDVCVIEISSAHEQVVGVVTDADACLENMSELQEGRGLSVAKETLQTVHNAEVGIISAVSAASEFYNVEFGSVENGLADL